MEPNNPVPMTTTTPSGTNPVDVPCPEQDEHDDALSSADDAVEYDLSR